MIIVIIHFNYETSLKESKMDYRKTQAPRVGSMV